MNTAAVISSAPRTPPNLGHAFGGVWRLTYRRFLSPGSWIALGALAAVLALLTLTTVRTGRADQYFSWTIEFYLSFVLPIVAFLSGAAAIRDDMRPTAIDYVLTRPVRRPAYVVFRYLSHLACVQIGYLVAFAVLLGAGVLEKIPGVWSALPQLLLAQMLCAAGFVALGFFAGALTTRYLVLGLTYGGIVEAGIGSIPTQLSRLSMVRHIQAMLHDLLPARAEIPFAQSAATTTAVLLLVAALLVAGTAAVFSFREFAGEKPKDG